jgi:hypothetical protein
MVSWPGRPARKFNSACGLVHAKRDGERGQYRPARRRVCSVHIPLVLPEMTLIDAICDALNTGVGTT